MKSVILVLVCVSLVGCALMPTVELPPQDAAEPCLPARNGCIVGVDGLSLIRAPTFWLLDLRGRSEFDAGAVINAADQCDGPQGCGVAMAKPEVDALVGELVQANLEKLSVAGEPVAAYVLPQGIVLQAWAAPKSIVSQLPPIDSLPGVQCQCELPPPIPPRDEDAFVRALLGAAAWKDEVSPRDSRGD